MLLSVLDRKWREHLYEMDYLREGIGLRAYSQRDPLVEYQREGFDLFSAMMDSIKEESVGYLFNVEVHGRRRPTRSTTTTPTTSTRTRTTHDHEHEHDHDRPNIVAKGLVDAADAAQAVVLRADRRR